MSSSSVTLNEKFLEHVQSSCLQKFSPLYFTVGLVEEVAELAEEYRKATPDRAEIEAEVGDVCWYLYALCNSLEGVLPIISDDDNHDRTVDSKSISIPLLFGF